MKNLKKKASILLASALAISLLAVYPAAACNKKLSLDQIKSKVSCIIKGSCKSNIDIDKLIAAVKNKADKNNKDQNSCNDKSDCTSKAPAKSDNTGSKTEGKADNKADNKTNSNTENKKDNKSDSKNDQSSSNENKTESKNESSSVLEYEKEVVRLVNEIRASYGLNELKINEKLCSVAREKSKNMHDLGYFSHTSPTYGSPFDMMKKFGITYRSAGENIAMGYSTPKAVVDAWMNSEGHRANILNSSFTEIGVGYISSGNYWTQMFIG